MLTLLRYTHIHEYTNTCVLSIHVCIDCKLLAHISTLLRIQVTYTPSTVVCINSKLLECIQHYYVHIHAIYTPVCLECILRGIMRIVSNFLSLIGKYYETR